MNRPGFQTLEQGDWIERNYAKRIREQIPLYETIWSQYIGHDGRGQPLPILGLSRDLQQNREKFYQAHYSTMVALIQLQDICDEHQRSLGQVGSVSDYIRLQRDIVTFMSFVGRVRDMMKKMDSALHLGGAVWKKFADFYQQRSNYLHSPIPAQRIDSEGLVSMAAPAGLPAAETDWFDESRWSDSEQKRFVEVADFMRETLKELFQETHAACSQFLGVLKSTLPKVTPSTSYKTVDQASFDTNATWPISGSQTFQAPAASGFIPP